MDISNLVTQNLAEEGKWFRVELYGQEQDFWAKIKGADSDAVQQFKREQFKKLNKLKRNKNNEFEEDALDEFLDNNLEDVVVRLCGLASDVKGSPDETEPLVMKGIQLKSDTRSYKIICEKIPEFKEWVLKKSNERLDFLPPMKKN